MGFHIYIHINGRLLTSMLMACTESRLWHHLYLYLPGGEMSAMQDWLVLHQQPPGPPCLLTKNEALFWPILALNNMATIWTMNGGMLLIIVVIMTFTVKLF